MRQSSACRADPGRLLARSCREFPLPAFSSWQMLVLHMHVNMAVLPSQESPDRLRPRDDNVTTASIGQLTWVTAG